MEDLKAVRVIAEKIPIAQSCYIHPNILSRMVAHRQNILSSDDVDLVKDYINRSTNEECLAVLAEIEHHAPLSDDYQRVFYHLARRVFTAVGLKIPTQVRLTADPGELNSQLEALLENLRSDIRKTQSGILRGASLQ